MPLNERTGFGRALTADRHGCLVPQRSEGTSQRPSEVNRTVLSQCNNFIAMRLTNPDDQNIIKRLFPDNLEGFANTLPTLDVGEALVVGDAVLLPTRIKIDPPEPKHQPTSQTIKFWTEWSKDEAPDAIDKSVEAWRRQSMH